jgi:ribonuclease BN (tRNA processing enzyme)
MKVTTYGTRGSTAGQPRGSFNGMHTTSLRIHSDRIPADWALVVDTGTGFVDLSKDLLKEGKKKVCIVFTHYHHDHTIGLCLAPHTFMAEELLVYGPKEHKVGPREVLAGLMTAPVFPVEFAKLQHRFTFKPLEKIGTQVLVIHPEAGFHLLPIHVYNRGLSNGRTFDARTGGKIKIDECLTVFMYKTDHPEYTVSFGFVEGPTKRKLVFLTDHEAMSAHPFELLNHVKGAHVLIQDAQYSTIQYENGKAGFGHGTPEYCANLAIAAEVERLYLTHHDPDATDEDIGARVNEAVQYANERGKAAFAEQIAAASDYKTYDV